ncbi:cytochrome C [Azospirillum sp. RWY-5-1]|uniref:Cytochrome C n=1 Tax=Azospirillum oleiclasticum TaxID=2735135 RepID=A0ABX2TG24_9PROT|nr:cytochrome C [Azospirillum oleiclasticum]NYZ22132.1 cytochrome C [Azospirillum oleiclasticum]
MIGRLFAPMILIVVAGTMVASTSLAADPVAGRGIAERWCLSCHAGPGGRSGSDAAPTLESLGRQRHDRPHWVRGWLTAPHPPMPDVPLTRDEIEDVVAYLESLAD